MKSMHTISARLGRVCVLVGLGWGSLHSNTPNDYAWKTLKDGAKDKRPDKRAEAVSALGIVSSNPEAIKLAENALQDSNSSVRNAAVSALGEMGAKTSLPKIKALLKDSDARGVVTIAAVLKKFNDPEGFEIYYEILTGQRKGSGGILAGIKDKKALEKMGIEEALGFVPFASIGLGAYNYIKANDSLAVNAVAATELALDPDPRAEKALIQATPDGKDIVRLAALRALAKRGDPAVAADIAHQMYSERSMVSYTAAAVVVHLTDVRERRVRRATRATN